MRHTALPAPGTEEQLLRLAARIASQQLDRSKPLWEIWLVEGLEGDRFALISKTHHSLVDGVSGVDLATVLFDARSDRRPRRRPSSSRGSRSPSRPPPTSWWPACAASSSATSRVATRAVSAATPPGDLGRRACATPPRASARSSGPG